MRCPYSNTCHWYLPDGYTCNNSAAFGQYSPGCYRKMEEKKKLKKELRWKKIKSKVGLRV